MQPILAGFLANAFGDRDVFPCYHLQRLASFLEENCLLAFPCKLCC